AADENILHSTRATDFITPKSTISRIFRDAVLTLARSHPFARQLVNSGRLSTPALYRDSPLNTPDRDHFDAGLAPGTPCCDAPLVLDGEPGWLLRQLGRQSGHFDLLLFGSEQGVPAQWPVTLERLRRAPAPL